MNKHLTWINEAKKHIGLKEIPGKAHNPTIIRWLNQLKAWWSEDETPWCGTFVAHCLKTTDHDLPKHWYRAKDWLKTGELLLKPAYGCIAVFERQGGGHVGFVVGKDKNGNLMILGGNQANSVTIMPFAPSRVIGYRWPSKNGMPSQPQAMNNQLPLLASNGKLSQNEA